MQWIFYIVKVHNKQKEFIVYYLGNPAMPGNWTFFLKIKFLNQTKDIPVVLPRYTIKDCGEHVKWFLSYNRTYRQINRDYYLIYIGTLNGRLCIHRNRHGYWIMYCCGKNISYCMCINNEHVMDQVTLDLVWTGERRLTCLTADSLN